MSHLWSRGEQIYVFMCQVRQVLVPLLAILRGRLVEKVNEQNKQSLLSAVPPIRSSSSGGYAVDSLGGMEISN